MDRRALLRVLDPLERNVLLLYARYRDSRAVLDALRGDPARKIEYDPESNEMRIVSTTRARKSLSVDGEYIPVVPRLTVGEVEEILVRARAKLERAAQQLRFREERERRERRRRARRRKEVVVMNGDSPAPRPGESWGARVLREAKERRTSAIEEVLPRLAEILEAESVIKAFGELPLWREAEYESVIDFGRSIDFEPDEDEVVDAEVEEGKGLAELDEEPPPGFRRARPDDYEPPLDPPPDEFVREDEPPAVSEVEEPAAAPKVGDDGAGRETAGEQAETPRSSKAEIARERDQRVLDYLAENGPTEKVAVGAALGIPDGSWGTILARAERNGYGLESRTVPDRTSSSRQKVAFLYLTGQEPPDEVRDEEEAEPVPPPGPPSAPRLTAEMVRDAIVGSPAIRKNRTVFSASTLVGLLDEEVRSAYASERALVGEVTDCLNGFVGTVVERVSQMGNDNRFRYLDRVDDEPRRASRGREELPSVSNGRGQTVEGTGRKDRGSHPEVAKLIDAARAAGATVERGQGQHWKVTLNGRMVTFGSTPSYGGLRDARASLRRIGVPV